MLRFKPFLRVKSSSLAYIGSWRKHTIHGQYSGHRVKRKRENANAPREPRRIGTKFASQFHCKRKQITHNQLHSMQLTQCPKIRYSAHDFHTELFLQKNQSYHPIISQPITANIAGMKPTENAVGRLRNGANWTIYQWLWLKVEWHAVPMATCICLAEWTRTLRPRCWTRCGAMTWSQTQISGVAATAPEPRWRCLHPSRPDNLSPSEQYVAARWLHSFFVFIESDAYKAYGIWADDCCEK